MQGGFSRVLVKGPFIIVENTEESSTSFDYTEDDLLEPSITIVLRDPAEMETRVDTYISGAARVFTEQDRQRLYDITPNIPSDWAANNDTEPGFIFNKPKLGPAAYMSLTDIASALLGSPPPGNAGVISVNGQIGEVRLSTEDIPEAVDRRYLTEAERAKLNAFDLNARLRWGFIADKPQFGTIASRDASDFATASHTHSGNDITQGVINKNRLPKLTELRGVTIGSQPPTGGANGDIHIQVI